MSRILLGVTGSVAAYKSLEFVRLAVKAGHSVRVTQTAASLKFIGKASFKAVSGAPVLVEQFDGDPMRGAYPGDELPAHGPIPHLELVERADAFLIAPATANTIAKLACGISDSLLTDAYLACKVPVIIAPAMNTSMWEHDATERNIEVLRQRGDTIVEPETGDLASMGEWGVGRLPDSNKLLAVVESAAIAGSSGSMSGLNVLVTAGGTREPIDSVRYLGNRSSGKMGFALAEEASRRGAQVTVLASNVDLPRSRNIEYTEANTAEEMHNRAAEEFPATNVLLMVAAVADFRPASPSPGKISKEHGNFKLELTETADIVSELAAQRKPGQVVVGFAAEHGEGGLKRAKRKLRDKELDAIVLNDISRSDIGFEADSNEVTLIDSDGATEPVKASKQKTASLILDHVEQLLKGLRS